MKNIIVPVDFSVYSENAFLSALKIASKSNSSIICLTIIMSELNWSALSQEEKNKQTEINDCIEEAKEKIKLFIEKHRQGRENVSSKVLVGIPCEKITESVDELNADLVVIGAHGNQEKGTRFIGSTLQKVLRNANCPVLTVKKPISGTDLRKMAFASLFNNISLNAFNQLKPIIKAMRSTVHFLYINTPHNFTHSKVADQAMKKYALGHEDLIIQKHIYNHDEPEAGIIEFSLFNNMGYVAIASNNRKNSSSYHVGITETLIYKSDLPILSVKYE
jgi:nucleotide-binding universal stress UspA family protein